MDKFVKVMDGLESNAGDFRYKLNEINIADNWNPNAKSGKDFGGFNYCSEKCIIRWLHRGDTIYDVEVPKDASNIELKGATTIYRCNKIIIKNPRKIDDDMAMYFYEISDIPDISYPNTLAILCLKDYKNTAMKLINDRVNKDNIDFYLEEWNDFLSKHDRKNSTKTIIEIEKILKEIKNG